MTPARKKRLWMVALILIGVGSAAALALNAFRENLLFFYSPTQVAQGEAPLGRMVRIGGLVKAGSVQREGMTVRFVVTDNAHEIPVVYTGILPDLFREGQGIIAHGRLENGVFMATEVLAKHDENYMPPEVAEALKTAHGDKP
ncbi:MAG: cytochrome c maturation protein CcmE [Gammaproteobacteria bacterium]|nr:MAG: cytochrome c maturation protein CcmE [Gammaproteobacteria bacterium]